MAQALLVFTAAAGVSWVLSAVVYRVLGHWQIVDRPNSRSSHTRPTVRGGGMAIIATSMGGGLWLAFDTGHRPLIGLGLLALALGLLSFMDDLRSIRASVRLALHFSAAVVFVVSLGITRMGAGGSKELGFLSATLLASVISCFWIVGHTNAFNFMDGINGLAVSQAVMTGFGMALLAGLVRQDFTSPPVLLCLAIAGAALGFLPYNFPVARMFMGDVGSAPLGFLLGALVILLAKEIGIWLAIPLALLHANFVLDTGITLLRRAVRGERLQEAHREHFYQRLIRSGKSHSMVTALEMGLQVLVLGLITLYLRANSPMRAGIAGIVVIIWLSFFIYCEFSFRQRHSVGERRLDN